jgi:tetratricopeptide (TPR) repeat protein
MQPEPLRPSKAFFFGAILWTFLLVVPLLAVEGLVRAVGWQAPNDPYINFSRVTSFFADAKIHGIAHKVVQARELYREREISFAARKLEGTFRIFCLGGSASAGWPHPHREIYSAYLESALKRAYPHRAIEVINVSAHAYAAYRVRLIFQEVLAFEPDLLVIYSGNNEFIEPRLYSTRQQWYDALESFAKQFAAYRVFRGSSIGAKLFSEQNFRAESRGGVAFEQWSKVDKLPLALRTDPGQLEKVVEHYQFSILSMVQAAKSRGVPVVLLTVPTNLRDWQPNVSVHAVKDGSQLEGWKTLYVKGRAALLRGEAGTAVESLAKASALDPSHAETHYWRGRALEAAGRLDEAFAAYDLARNLDANPFRAISRFNDIVRSVGASQDNTKVVDAELIFRAASHPLAPGFDLFLDYVHPTKKGNLILARHVFDTIVASGILGPASSLFQHVPETDESGRTYDSTKDSSLQETLVVLAMLMHQYETVVSVAGHLLANPGLLGQLTPRLQQRVRTAHDIFRDVIELERRELLEGDVPAVEKERLELRMAELYRTIFANYAEYQKQKPR